MTSLLNRKAYTILGLVLVLGTITAYLITSSVNSSADTSHSKPAATGAAMPSEFSFSGANDWWQGATNKTSMALFYNYDCFASVQYKTGTVDTAAALQKGQADQADGGTTTPGAVETLTLRTSSGPQQYELHQYSVSSVGGKQLMGGLELGYLQLSGGYVKIEGHCNTADELPATIPALQAITFDAAD